MSRKSEIDRKKKLLAEIKAGKVIKKVKKVEKKEVEKKEVKKKIKKK